MTNSNNGIFIKPFSGITLDQCPDYIKMKVITISQKKYFTQNLMITEIQELASGKWKLRSIISLRICPIIAQTVNQNIELNTNTIGGQHMGTIWMVPNQNQGSGSVLEN